MKILGHLQTFLSSFLSPFAEFPSVLNVTFTLILRSQPEGNINVSIKRRGISLTPLKFFAISGLEWKSNLFCENINVIFY